MELAGFLGVTMLWVKAAHVIFVIFFMAGLFMMPLHPPQRPMHETLAENTEKSLLADRLGFNELWIGEHFSATSEPIPSPLMFMAGLISAAVSVALSRIAETMLTQ